MDDTLMTCQATRADGQPCEAKARPSGFCWAHDPELAEQRRAGNAEGGANSSRYVRAQRLLPTQLRPVLALLVKGMQQCHTGELEPARLSAMSAAAGAIARLYGTIELEQQVAELEARHGVGE